MRPGLIVLLLVALALVMLSVVGLASRGSVRPDVDAWRKRWFPRDAGGSGGPGLSRVERSAVKEAPPGCLASFTQSSCRLQVAGASAFLRRLELSSFDQVVVDFVPTRSGQAVQAKLTGSFDAKSLDLLIDSSGAELTFTCVTPRPTRRPPTCAVQVELTPRAARSEAPSPPR